MKTISSSDRLAIFEAALVALNDSSLFERIAEHLDMSKVELSRIRQNLRGYMSRPVKEKNEVWLMLATEGGAIRAPVVCRTPGKATASYYKYAELCGAPWDDEADDYDWSCMQESAAVYGINLDTLEVI